jgi:hypothetical protein
MPSLLARHMTGPLIFITLDEMADARPDLFESIGGAVPEPPEPAGHAELAAAALEADSGGKGDAHA